MSEFTIKNAENYIKDNKDKVNKQYRYRYHIMGECGWINDPNGFSFFNDNYHIFYQHYPYASHWGPMHWGHVVSKDLVKWEYVEVAIAPDEPYDAGGCFSGSAIVHNKKLVLVYTGHTNPEPDNWQKIRQVQCISTSLDGIKFEKEKKNPVIPTIMLPDNVSVQDFRDPKVFKKDGSFYVVVGSRNLDDSGQILLYKSKDLINWVFVNTILRSENKFGKMWECPDLLTLDDKDLLIMSPQFLAKDGNKYHNVHSSTYMVGKLNYETGIYTYDFVDEIDSGLDFYAPQTTIAKDGRTLMTAWMQMWDREIPTQKDNWAGGMILTRELSLKENKLYQAPVREIENYRKNTVVISNQLINKSIEFASIKGNCIELEVELKNINSNIFGLKLLKNNECETLLKYDVLEKCFIFNRDNSGIDPKGERRVNVDLVKDTLKLRIFIDISSVEIFINDGEKAMANTVYPINNADNIEFFSDETIEIVSLKKHDIVL